MNSLNQIVPNLNNINVKTFVQQNFSFRRPFIHYLIKNATVKVLQKFHRCCKYFFIHGKIALLKNLKISSDISEPFHSEETLCLPSSNGKLNLFHKILVYGKLECDVPRYRVKENPKTLSSVISNHLYQCEAEFILIENQDLAASELKFLLSKKTKSVEMKFCKISLLKCIRQFVENYTNKARVYCVESCYLCCSAESFRRNYLNGDVICRYCATCQEDSKYLKYPWISPCAHTTHWYTSKLEFEIFQRLFKD